MSGWWPARTQPVMRSVSISGELAHAHLMSRQVCPEASGEERFEVSASKSAIMFCGMVGRALITLGGGSSSSLFGTSGGTSTKNLQESVREISACVWTMPSSERRGGTLFILLLCRQVATSQRLDF